MQVTRTGKDSDSLTVVGEIDYSTSPQLREEIERVLSTRPQQLRLRVSEVEFVDSSGLSVLLEAARGAEVLGTKLTLVQPSRQLLRVLTVAGFTPFFNIEYGDLSEQPAAAGLESDVDSGPVASQTLEIDCRPENIRSVRKAVSRFVEDLSFAKSDVDDIKLAVGEAMTNALRYGCPAGVEPIQVTLSRSDGTFTVRVTDNGPGFDPAQISEKDMAEAREGGRGIFFMRMLMDEVKFHFHNGTTVEMTKRASTPAGSSI